MSSGISKRKKLVLLGEEIKPGEKIQMELEVAKLHTRTSIEIPIIVNRAMQDGPVVLFIAGIHGDEINGVEIVRRIICSKQFAPTRGTIICIPVFNIFGFLNLSRQFPDGRDLNRVFPGSKNGSLASRFAYHFKKEIAPVVDYVVDFHTGGADRFNAPQIRCLFSDQKSFELANAFGAPFVINSKFIPKSLRETLFKMGKTALLFEGGKTQSFDDEVIECGERGAWNILKSLNMMEGEVKLEQPPIIIERSGWLRAPHSGMLHLKVKNGSRVKKGALLGTITDPYGEFVNKVKSTHDAYVFCINTSPIVNRGDALFNLSLDPGSAL